MLQTNKNIYYHSKYIICTVQLRGLLKTPDKLYIISMSASREECITPRVRRGFKFLRESMPSDPLENMCTLRPTPTPRKKGYIYCMKADELGHVILMNLLRNFHSIFSITKM